MSACTGGCRRAAEDIMVETLAVPINDACRSIGIKRTKLYALIGEGKIATVKIGRRTLVKAESLRALVEAA